MKRGNRHTGSTYELHLKFIQGNLVRLGHEAMAKHIGVTVPSLKRQLSEWRRNGIDIPHLRTIKTGSITTRMSKGIKYEFLKTVTGWECLGRLTPYKNGEPPQNKPAKPRKECVETRTMRTLPKEIKRLPDRVVDEKQMKLVKVDSKTHIQVDINTPDDVAISNWYKKMKRA